MKWNGVKCTDKGVTYEQWCYLASRPCTRVAVEIEDGGCSSTCIWFLIVSSKRRLRSVSWKVQLLVWDTQTQHRVLSMLWASTEYFNGVNLVSYDIFSCVVHKASSGLGLLIVEVSRSHRHTHTHARTRTRAHTHAHAHTHTHTKSVESPVRVICPSHRPLPTQQKRRKSMPSAGFEPAVPAVGWLQTYTLERTATGDR